MTRPEFKAHVETQVLGAHMDKPELERVLRRLFADYGQRFDTDFELQSKDVLLVRNPETGQMNSAPSAIRRCAPACRATSWINLTEDLTTARGTSSVWSAPSAPKKTTFVASRTGQPNPKPRRHPPGPSSGRPVDQHLGRVGADAGREPALLHRLPDGMDVLPLLLLELHWQAKRCTGPWRLHGRKLAERGQFHRCGTLGKPRHPDPSHDGKPRLEPLLLPPVDFGLRSGWRSKPSETPKARPWWGCCS